jgi:ribosomal protein L37AE/L43A
MNADIEVTALTQTTSEKPVAETDIVLSHSCPECKTQLMFFKEIISEYHDSIFNCSCCDTSLIGHLTTPGKTIEFTLSTFKGALA